MTVRRFVPDSESESGFGMVEIVVAMFLLAVLAVTVLPVLISSLNLSVRNVSLTTSTQLVNQSMDEARGLAATCKALQVYSAESLGLLMTDPRGTVLEIHREVPATCPTIYPASFLFTSWVGVQGESAHLAEAQTRILITSSGY